MAALTLVHDSKVQGLVRLVDVHEEVPGPFQFLTVESMSTRNVQNRPRDQEPCDRPGLGETHLTHEDRMRSHAFCHSRW